MIEGVIFSSLALYGFFMLFNNIRMGSIAFKVHKFLNDASPKRSYTVVHIAMELGIDKDDIAMACISDKRIKPGILGSYDEWKIKIYRI